jgi:hypothetical protein
MLCNEKIVNTFFMKTSHAGILHIAQADTYSRIPVLRYTICLYNQGQSLKQPIGNCILAKTSSILRTCTLHSVQYNVPPFLTKYQLWELFCLRPNHIQYM